MSKKHSGKITWVGPEDSSFREWWQRTHDLEEEQDGGNQMKKTSRLHSMAALPVANPNPLMGALPPHPPTTHMLMPDTYDAPEMLKKGQLDSLNGMFLHFPHLRAEILFSPDATAENRAFLYYAVIETTRTVKQKPVAHYYPKVDLFHTQDELHQYLVEMLEQPLLTVLLTGRRGNWQLFDWNDVADGYDFACPGDWLMPPMFGDNIAFCKPDRVVRFDVSGEWAEGQGNTDMVWDGGASYIPVALSHFERPVHDELNKLTYYSMSGQRRLNFLEHREMGQIKITKQLALDAAEYSGWFDSQTGKCRVTLKALLDVAVRGVQ